MGVTLEFGVLGPLEVTELGRPVALSGGKARCLLATLLVHRGRVLSTDRLIEELWEENPPADAANALQVKVSQLRRAIGPARLVTRCPGYSLEVEPHDVDAVRFERLVRQGRQAVARGAWQEAGTALREAGELWRGPALATVDGTSVRIEARRLEEARLNALEDRIDAELALGLHRELVGELQALVSEHPFRERLWAQLILALYRSGRQSEALRVYQQARQALVEQLGLEPGVELRRMEAAVLAQDPSLGTPPPPPAVGEALPSTSSSPVALTRFVGRQQALASVCAMLGDARLVTLTGAGGVGKTRLALEAVATLRTSVADGVWVVELGRVTDGAAVPWAVASVLGVRDVGGSGPPQRLEDRLVRFVRSKRLLLVLDNCEHVVAATASIVEELLRGCDQLRVLATSREPLAVPGEVRWRVPSLEVPEADVEDPEVIGASEAVQLFVDRASAVQPGFSLTSETAPAVAEICRRLDGIPLGIELGAARVNALPVTEISSRLDDRFRFLVGGARTALPRHQTLRALVEWSYDLLSEDERLVFERLSLFVAGASLDAAERVCAGAGVDESSVVEVIGRLVDKSLLVAVEGVGGRVRYRMAETLREYGRERLVASGGHDEARRHQGEWFVTLAEAAEPAAWGSRQEEWLGRLDEDHDDIRSVLDWLVHAPEPELALRLGGALGWYWYVRGRQREGRDRLEAGLSVAHGGQVSARVRAKALAWAGYLAQADLDVDTAVALCEEALSLVAGCDDPHALAGTQLLLAIVLVRRGEHERVIELVQEAAACFTRTGDAGAIGWCHHALCIDALSGGDLSASWAACSDALSHFKASGNRWGMGRMNYVLGAIAQIRGGHEDAVIFYEECLVHARALGAREVEVTALAQLGHLAERTGDRDRAEACHQQARASARRVGGADTGNIGAAPTATQRRGDLARAQNLTRETLGWYRQAGDDEGAALCLEWLAFLTEATGDHVEAERRHRDVVQLAAAAGKPRPLVRGLEALARVAVALDDNARGVTLLEAADGMRRSWGIPRAGWEQAEADRVAATARAAVGEGCFVAAGARGRSMPVEEALSLAGAR
ncbi:MAG: winged helix-turn-helix domain-containing protein [Actinomycetota bacterium]|nr:winged helix-turn-helix domain-containing protein [Actinomycetota bacterium]